MDVVEHQRREVEEVVKRWEGRERVREMMASEQGEEMMRYLV